MPVSPERQATLEEAQQAKLKLICKKLWLKAGETVVEAECGWGALSLYMAREYGVRVKAYNLLSKCYLRCMVSSIRREFQDKSNRISGRDGN